VLEAARILAAAKVRPARTIRFVLFTGEEEGLFGSDAYAKAHAGELGQYQVALVMDNGSGRITGMALQGRNELRDAWVSLFAPLAPIGPFAVRAANKPGTDHLSFLPYGVPAFNYDQAQLGYPHTHHTQIDTYEHASPAGVGQAATVMAVNAYQWASATTLAPRGPIQAAGH
jgi:carboxypeptidase Q